VLDAVRRGDASAFAALAERYRRPLLAHCYRMVGSIDDAEDLVQETLLRAWRGRLEFEGRSLVRTWLYRIATNVCLNALERAPRRVMPQDVAPPVKPGFDPADARDTPPLGAGDSVAAALPRSSARTSRVGRDPSRRDDRVA
jgi:RNA polymerase sigma-70 factor (ECF subfamily)